MKVTFCGGAGEVGASCILLNIGGKNLVIDSGIRMNASDSLPDMRLIQENGGADAILISHAHMDHCGSLPILSREYPQARIYMTHATQDLIRVLLADSLKIMEHREAEIPLYAEIHVKNALEKVVCYSPGYTYHPCDSAEIAVTFYQAGHIAGAVAIYITSPEGSCFYSGDFSVFPQKTVAGAAIPRLRPDLAIFESTYGDRLHSNREIEEDRLVQQVGEVIAAGKKILIPAFALGRAQEVILLLKRAFNKGQLPKFNVYVDGMVNDICRVYKLNPNYLRHTLAKKIFRGIDIFYEDTIIAVTGRQPQREEIISRNEPCCIIASSGMLTGGPSQWYAQKLAGDEGNYIALTGYQDEESPGRQLLELAEQPVGPERRLKLGELSLPFKCKIGKYGLSAHADKTEIISSVHSLNARNVFLIHGNPDTAVSLAKDIQTEYRGRVHAPANGDSVELKLNNPRKQWEKKRLSALNKTNLPQESDLPELWRHLLDQCGTTAGFTVEDLLSLWTGKSEFAESDYQSLIRLLNSSRHFETETRRPFIFHVVSPAALAETESVPEMEVNQMLTLVDARFPPQTGLYKKGARFEEKIALLSFDFPLAARQKYQQNFAEFEEETGWKITVNTECNISAAQNLIWQLLDQEVTAAGKISYFNIENRFKVQLLSEINDRNAIQTAFREHTGMELIIEGPGNEATIQSAPVKAASYQVEQNQALSAIQTAFEGKADKLYKKSLKIFDGQPGIELSFISPQVGERYRELLDQLESRLRWPIRINPTPNQNELLNTGRLLLIKNGIPVRKNLSYLPKEQLVVAAVQQATPEQLERVGAEFQRLTGMTLIFETQ